MDVPAVLRAWQAQGLDRTEPLRYHRVAALHRRALRHEGATRRLLDARLAQLLAGAEPTTPPVARQPAPGTAAIGALAARLEGQSRVRPPGDVPGAVSEPEVLLELRDLWAETLARNRVRQSLAAPSGQAGPLNSTTLVHRSLALMRDLAPDYLRHFLAHADALSWLERMGSGELATDRPASRGGRPARGKARGRKS